jgi:hypothetical protein
MIMNLGLAQLVLTALFEIPQQSLVFAFLCSKNSRTLCGWHTRILTHVKLVAALEVH